MQEQSKKQMQQEWEQYVPAFREKTSQFYQGTLSKGDYKAFSGFYGSYAQRGGNANMLRLRMPCGQVTKENLAFTAKAIKDYQITRMHFTTCQTIQFHDLSGETAADLIESALKAGIITIGGGGDYPRNVMCSPLSGVEKEEYFDVLPWAKAAGDYLLQLIPKKKMPRKLKIAFSNSKKNVTHVTYRDLGFAATKEGRFDVYSAGGLGVNPLFGVKVASGVEPEMVLYYIKAMWLTFLTYGNYESRIKARTRYMQEALGGPSQYAAAYQEKLNEVLQSDDLRLSKELWRTSNLTHKLEKKKIASKQTDCIQNKDCRMIAQKQNGLFSVAWHPIGGQPDVNVFCTVNQIIQSIEGAELRLGPDETAYIINLTEQEAQKVLKATDSDSAASLFEASVSCIGASICQVGLRDSQELLSTCVKAVRAASLPKHVLPQIHISGCPSSCGTHQTNVIGFRGAMKQVDGKPQPGFLLYVNGCEKQGNESMGCELGFLLDHNIPQFLINLGKTVANSGMSFDEWYKNNPDAKNKIGEIASELVI